MYKEYSGNSVSENALQSWKIDYTKNDDMSVVEQLTDNIALIDVILKDKEHLLEHLNELQEIVKNLKVFGAAAVCRHYEGSAYVPEVMNLMTPAEQQEVQSINNPVDFSDFMDDVPKPRHM